MDKQGKKGMKKRFLAVAVLIVLSTLVFAPAASAAAAPAGAASECTTKYPVVLVHGAGFTDMNFGINYWGRIPKTLEEKGAKIFYGGTDSWCTVEQGAADLKTTIERALTETGSAKVNLIAHSKGGLEARYMIASLGMAGKVATLTTISTPHQGSVTLDKILGFPDFLLRGASVVWSGVRKVFGDRNPDFYNGMQSLGTEYMKEFNKKNPDQPGVYYQSFAGKLYAPASDLVLSIPAYLIKTGDGPNDGMVTVESAKWANFRGEICGAGYRGISHADEVDFRRTDIEIEPLLGANNVRDFYAAVVAELKQKGY